MVEIASCHAPLIAQRGHVERQTQVASLGSTARARAAHTPTPSGTPTTADRPAPLVTSPHPSPLRSLFPSPTCNVPRSTFNVQPPWPRPCTKSSPRRRSRRARHQDKAALLLGCPLRVLQLPMPRTRPWITMRLLLGWIFPTPIGSDPDRPPTVPRRCTTIPLPERTVRYTRPPINPFFVPDPIPSTR